MRRVFIAAALLAGCASADPSFRQFLEESSPREAKSPEVPSDSVVVKTERGVVIGEVDGKTLMLADIRGNVTMAVGEHVILARAGAMSFKFKLKAESGRGYRIRQDYPPGRKVAPSWGDRLLAFGKPVEVVSTGPAYRLRLEDSATGAEAGEVLESVAARLLDDSPLQLPASLRWTPPHDWQKLRVERNAERVLVRWEGEKRWDLYSAVVSVRESPRPLHAKAFLKDVRARRLAAREPYLVKVLEEVVEPVTDAGPLCVRTRRAVILQEGEGGAVTTGDIGTAIVGSIILAGMVPKVLVESEGFVCRKDVHEVELRFTHRTVNKNKDPDLAAAAARSFAQLGPF